jgi:hypothetical protein
VQVVIVSDYPASTPERITPVSSIGGGEVGWRPFSLTTQSEVPTDVVFRSAAERESNTCCSVDATPVSGEVTRSEANNGKGRSFDSSPAKCNKKLPMYWFWFNLKTLMSWPPPTGCAKVSALV